MERAIALKRRTQYKTAKPRGLDNEEIRAKKKEKPNKKSTKRGLSSPK